MNCEDIKGIVGITLGLDLNSRRRSRKFTEARFIYWDLAMRNADDFSVSWAATIVGRTHASAIHGLKTHEALMEYDKLYSKKYEDCRLGLLKYRRPKKINPIVNRSLSNRVAI